MKNSCRTIEPFLYLYRKDELTVEERTVVADHIAGCANCRKILSDLHSMEAALAPARSDTPELAGDETIVANVMAELTRKSGRKTGLFPVSPAEFFGWARPALSFALLALAILFLVQEYRDASSVAELEHRLQLRGVAAGSTRNDLMLDRHFLTGLSATGNRAVIDPLQLVGTTLPRILGQRPGLFDELAKRYPELSRITMEDGLDEHEKAILATEGKEFLKEVEQLVREGAK